MLDWLQFFTVCVDSLEGEVERLRAENRALTNSLLGTAGFPPVELPGDVEAAARLAALAEAFVAPDSSVARNGSGTRCGRGL